MNITRRTFLAVAVVGLAACATARNAGQSQADTILVVDNQVLLDMNIYVLRGLERIRLGMAMGLRKTSLKIPSDLIFGATPLRFIADPIGGNRLPVSDEITVSPGDTVGITIPPV